MKLVILEIFKLSSFGLLKATKLVIIRSLFCNFLMLELFDKFKGRELGHSLSVARKNPTQIVLFKCICPKLNIFYFLYSKGSLAVGRCTFLGAIFLSMKQPVLLCSLSPQFQNSFCFQDWNYFSDTC